MRLRMWKSVLKALFDMPASVVMLVGRGEVWKVGKTDFSLYIAESLYSMGIIRKVASNIEIKRNPRQIPHKHIHNVPMLNAWSFRDSIPKLFIYDEAMASTPKRRAMSKLNVAWLSYIPQLSKGKVKLIVITQSEEYTDSVFYNPIFLRGLIEKFNLKTAQVRSLLIADGEYIIENIPRTSFRFDPYLISTFRADGDFETDFEDQETRMVMQWLEHGSMQKIARKENMHYQQVKRIILARVKSMLIGASEPKAN